MVLAKNNSLLKIGGDILKAGAVIGISALAGSLMIGGGGGAAELVSNNKRSLRTVEELLVNPVIVGGLTKKNINQELISRNVKEASTYLTNIKNRGRLSLLENSITLQKNLDKLSKKTYPFVQKLFDEPEFHCHRKKLKETRLDRMLNLSKQRVREGGIALVSNGSEISLKEKIMLEKIASSDPEEIKDFLKRIPIGSKFSLYELFTSGIGRENFIRGNTLETRLFHVFAQKKRIRQELLQNYNSFHHVLRKISSIQDKINLNYISDLQDDFYATKVIPYLKTIAQTKDDRIAETVVKILEKNVQDEIDSISQYMLMMKDFLRNTTVRDIVKMRAFDSITYRRQNLARFPSLAKFLDEKIGISSKLILL